MPEEADIGAAVDQCRLEQLVRHLPEEGAQQQDAEAEREGDLRQDHPGIGVQQPEIADLMKSGRMATAAGNSSPTMK